MPSPIVELRLLSGGLSLDKSLSTTLLPVRLQWAARVHNCQALLDSGVQGNFMDINLAQYLQIPIVPFIHKISVNAINGQTLPNITHTHTQTHTHTHTHTHTQLALSPLSLQEIILRNSHFRSLNLRWSLSFWAIPGWLITILGWIWAIISSWRGVICVLLPVLCLLVCLCLVICSRMRQ